MDQASQRQEDGHTKQASVFHSRLPGAAPPFLSGQLSHLAWSPPRTPSGLKPEGLVTRGLGQAFRGAWHPATHIEPAPAHAFDLGLLCVRESSSCL